MRFRAPATSANLGPGFDTLAVALALHVDVEVVPADAFSIRTEGVGAGVPRDRSHLAARVAIEVAGHDRLAICVRSQVPMARGLGSSAAVAAASAAAAGAPDPLAVAARFDGHPENAAAAVMGGLVSAAVADGRPLTAHHALDPAVVFVVLVPGADLPTGTARQALPATVRRADAVFNLGRMGLLLAGLADLRQLRPGAAEDRLHQDTRAPMFPPGPALITGLLAAGARAACWSGAGPSVLGISTRGEADQVARGGLRALAREGLEGQVLVLEPDLSGLTPVHGAAVDDAGRRG